MSTTAPPEKLELPKKLPIQFGHAVLQAPELWTRAEGGGETPEGPPKKRVYRIVISTETPIERYGALETLGHKKAEIDLSYAQNGITWMLEHGGVYRNVDPDPDYHLGIVEDLELVDGRLEGNATFADDSALSEIALRVKRDWESDNPTRRFISIGQKPVDYIEKKGLKPGEVSQRRWVRWQPREASIVSTPADANAGMRSDSGEFEIRNVSAQLETSSKEAPPMEGNEGTTTTTKPGDGSPAPAGAGVQVAEERVKARNAEVGEIVQLGESYKLGAEWVKDAIGRGLSLKDAKLEVLDKISTRGDTRLPAAESLEALGVPKKDLKKFSYRRAIVQALQTRNSGEYDGFEGEIHKALLKNKPQEMANNGGIFVPFDLRSEEEIVTAEERRMFMHRTMAANAPGKGMELVGETRMQLIELLQATSVLTRLGAQLNSGLTQPLSYPRVTSGPTVAFVGENPAADAAESDMVTGEILSNPKPMIGGVALSRGLIMQTGGQAESYATRLLSEGDALALDRAGFTGAGAGSQPTGLYFTPTVLTTAMGSVAPTYLKILDMIGKVADQNAEYGSMGFFCTAILAAFLMGKEEFSTTGRPIWTGTIQEGRIAGYRAIGSTQVSKVLGAGADEHGFGYGNWANCHVNRWGGIEVLVDPYTGALRGLIKVRTYGAGDIVFTQPQGYCVGTAAKAA